MHSVSFAAKIRVDNVTHQASRTFFVSGQAQHALHFGFSVVVVAGDGGVDVVVTSGDFDSELPIFLVSVHSKPNKNSDNELKRLLNCIRKTKITSALIVQGHLRFATQIEIDARKIQYENEIDDIYNDFLSSCARKCIFVDWIYSQYKIFMYDSVALAR